MEKSKEIKHDVCNKGNDVDDHVDNGVDNVDDSVDNGYDVAYTHLTHLSQADDGCLTEKSKQNKHF
eukprot:11223123-Ditylum_brightwellii.AAC.1